MSIGLSVLITVIGVTLLALVMISVWSFLGKTPEEKEGLRNRNDKTIRVEVPKSSSSEPDGYDLSSTSTTWEQPKYETQTVSIDDYDIDCKPKPPPDTSWVTMETINDHRRRFGLSWNPPEAGLSSADELQAYSDSLYDWIMHPVGPKPDVPNSIVIDGNDKKAMRKADLLRKIMRVADGLQTGYSHDPRYSAMPSMTHINEWYEDWLKDRSKHKVANSDPFVIGPREAIIPLRKPIVRNVEH